MDASDAAGKRQGKNGHCKDQTHGEDGYDEVIQNKSLAVGHSTKASDPHIRSFHVTSGRTDPWALGPQILTAMRQLSPSYSN